MIINHNAVKERQINTKWVKEMRGKDIAMIFALSPAITMIVLGSLGINATDRKSDRMPFSSPKQVQVQMNKARKDIIGPS
mmetsp:Transcript_57100/g.104427  ORF Transcript_57100/g.104427 Transcript_57100/m.104427 type:complete len:80 (+) Transcript_57100:53-292(+)